MEKSLRSEHEINFQARTRICEEALSEIRVLEKHGGYFRRFTWLPNRPKIATNDPDLVTTFSPNARTELCKPLRNECMTFAWIEADLQKPARERSEADFEEMVPG